MLQGTEIIVGPQHCHAVFNGIGYTLIVHICRYLCGVIRRPCQLLHHRLPGVYLIAVFIQSLVVEIKDSRICQIAQIGSYLVVAGIDVITVLEGFME